MVILLADPNAILSYYWSFMQVIKHSFEETVLQFFVIEATFLKLC